MKALKIGRGTAVDGSPFDLVLRACEPARTKSKLNALFAERRVSRLLSEIFERLDELEAVLDEGSASSRNDVNDVGLALAVNHRWLPSLRGTRRNRKGPQRS